MTFNIYITRTDDWTTSYDVWAKRGAVPLEEGDGQFVGNFPIDPSETELEEPIDYDEDYGFLVIPIRSRTGGPGTGYIA